MWRRRRKDDSLIETRSLIDRADDPGEWRDSGDGEWDDGASPGQRRRLKASSSSTRRKRKGGSGVNYTALGAYSESFGSSDGAAIAVKSGLGRRPDSSQSDYFNAVRAGAEAAAAWAEEKELQGYEAAGVGSMRMSNDAPGATAEDYARDHADLLRRHEHDSNDDDDDDDDDGDDAEGIPLLATGKAAEKVAKKRWKILTEQKIKTIAKLQKPSGYMTNERTAIKWISRSLDLGAIGTFVWSWIGTRGTGLALGAVLWLSAVAFMVYAAIRYHWRGETLAGMRQTKEGDPFGAIYDKWGPIVLAGVFMMGVVIMLVVISAFDSIKV